MRVKLTELSIILCKLFLPGSRGEAGQVTIWHIIDDNSPCCLERLGILPTPSDPVKGNRAFAVSPPRG
jgi:hypothetical protein